MIRLMAMVRRRHDMEPVEFHRYWREVHGPLVASTKSGQHAVRYLQHHRPLADYPNGPSTHDGVTEQWFTSLEDFYRSLQEDDYATISTDVERFIDTSALAWVLTDEPDVIIDSTFERTLGTAGEGTPAESDQP